MGLFSSSPDDRVCGIAVDDYGLRISTMSCTDRSLSSPADGEFVPLVDTVGSTQPSGLAETITALAGPAGPILQTEDNGEFGRTVTVGDGFGQRLTQLHDAIDADGWDGDTVVSIPADYADSAELSIRQHVEDSGFDVRQVVSHDVATSVIGAVDYEVNNEEYGSHPIVVVDVGLWEVTVTLAAVNLDEGRVRVRARDSVEAGLVDLLETAAQNALVGMGIPEEEVDLSTTAALHPLVREAFDPDTDSASGTVEIGGERVHARVGTEHFIDLLADISSVAESFATEFVLEAGYSTSEVHRVLVSGFGSEGRSGADLTMQLAATFTSADSMAAELGGGYAPERVYFGNEMMPEVGAADVAREAHDLERDIEILETLDVEAS
ncbi:hypothetical protein [Halobacterium noricense]|uniref:hypothetical protein n=1 Tax=Halobacterium noricense TaxID=223182 RepID=UPI001E3B9ACF|nr:hypothetical protein [Halobacterium noricense]UHH26504.1 hypothetical protein LT974_06090 [Halobacterium noricense]